MNKKYLDSRIFYISLFSILSLFFIFTEVSMAEAPPPVPSGQSGGAQASRFRDESVSEKKAYEKKKPKAPEIKIEEENAKPVEKGPAFVLKSVAVTGSTIFKAEDFEPIYKPYLDKSVTFQDMDNIAESISSLYKKRGYFTTNVYIPEQDVVAGKVEIRIQEGVLGDVKVEGNKFFSTRRITNYIHSKKNELLNIFSLGKDLQRLNQNSDLEVTSVISAGKNPGESDLTLNVKDKLPNHAGGGFDNQGTRLTGKYRDSMSFRSTSFLGCNDSVFFNTSMSALTQGNFISYTVPIDTYGTSIGLDVTVFDSKLGMEYKSFGITSNTQIYTPHITNEMYLSENFQASTNAGFDIKSIKKWVIGQKSTDDQLRMPFVELDFSLLDSFFGFGQTTYSSKFIFSTEHFLGASSYDHDSASRPATGGFFFQTIQTLRRIQRMPADSYLSVKAQFQNATRTLPSSEQMQLGGANYIRGYPEGDYLADYGGSLNVDWVFPLFFVPKDFKLPYSPTPLCRQIQPVAFMDMGAGKIKRPASFERETKFLMGLGGGLKIQINSNIFMNMYWAERVGDRPSQGQGPSNFNISFQVEI